MDKLLKIIILLSISFGHAQMSCEKGIKRATKDFKNKKYTLETLGQAVDKDFDPVLIAYAQTRFNIRITGSGCVVSPESDCYKKVMRAKVLKKFGNDIEDRIKAGALAAFKKTDKYLTEIKPKIDTGFVFNDGHTNAEYPGGETGLRAFLCNTIQETPKSYWTAYVTFIVEKDGTVSNLTFTKEPTAEAKAEVQRAFQSMEKWTPATYYGEKIRVLKSHSISSKKNMEMMDEIRQKQNAQWQQELLQRKQKKQPQKRSPVKKTKKQKSAK